MKTLGTLVVRPCFPSKNSVQGLLPCTYYNYHRSNRWIIYIVRSLSCNCQHLHVVSSKLFSLKIVLKLSCVILQCERVGCLGNQVEDCTKACCVFPVYTFEEWKFSGDTAMKLLSCLDNYINYPLRMYFKTLKWWADQQIRFLKPKYTFKHSLKPTSDSILNHSRPWYSVAVGSTVLLSVCLCLGVTILFWGVLCILSWSPLGACYISCQFFRWFICLSNIRWKKEIVLLLYASLCSFTCSFI